MTILIGEWDNNVAVLTKGRGYKVPLFSREELLVLEVLQEAMFKRILYLCWVENLRSSIGFESS